MYKQCLPVAQFEVMHQVDNEDRKEVEANIWKNHPAEFSQIFQNFPKFMVFHDFIKLDQLKLNFRFFAAFATFCSFLLCTIMQNLCSFWIIF